MTDPAEPDLSVAPVVRAAVSGLPSAERAVIVLRYFADLSVTGTASALGIPEGTVKTRARRGVELLRQAGLRIEDTL